MRRLDQWDAAEGLRLAFTDPTTGRSPIATMGAFMQLLPTGFKGTLAPLDRRAPSIAWVEGHGQVRVGGGGLERRPP